MTKRQTILFLLIVCLPLAVLAWLGSRLARHEREGVREQFHELLAEKLDDTDRVLAAYFAERERELLELTESIELAELAELAEPGNLDSNSIRQLVRRQPWVSQLFVLDSDGTLLHPDLADSLNDAERAFLLQAKEMLDGNELVRKTANDNESTQPVGYGWHVQYWGPGLQLVFFHRLASGRVVGVLLDRSRWIADLIAELPDTMPLDTTPPDATSSGMASPNAGRVPPVSRIGLVDSAGRTIYQWGSFEPDEGQEPVVESPLSEPLGSWRLRYFLPEDQLAVTGRSATFNLLSGLALVGIGLIVAAVYFYREHAREIRDATGRVNFVNQVSHELKTPLTSIRMYAELLESDLDRLDTEDTADDTALARGHLEVVVAESQRLSRLIGNVLTFARAQRNKLTLRTTTARVDEVIARVIERFEPSLVQNGIEVAFDGSAGEPVQLDVDALEQILGNLFGNVEKYATAGKRLEVTSRVEGDRVMIDVADRGPGIPAGLRERIFRPFYRISDRIENSPGTGIGLSIARQLARLHGGDVALADVDVGACFRVQLHTPPQLPSEHEP